MQVSFGREYSTSARIGIGREAPGVTLPEHVWEDSMAPSGLAIYNGNAFPEWRGSIFAGFLLAEQIQRVETGSEGVTHEESLP